MELDWFWEALREAGVDRIVFGATAPLQRWSMDKVFLPAMRCVRRDFIPKASHFKAIVPWREIAIVVWSAYGVGGLMVGFVMGDHAPLAVQAWAVSVVAMMVIGYGWLGVRQARRINRRMFA